MTQAMTVSGHGTAVATYSPEQIALIKRQVIKGSREATDDELKYFLAACGRSGLDPFRKQIWGILRYDGQAKAEVLSVQTSIDGYRAIAERSGVYQGQVGPQWCGADGQWCDVWLSDGPPAAARVGVYRKGFRDAVWGIALFREYAQRGREGALTGQWRTMPAHMLAIRAEANALKKSFTGELSGLVAEEIASVDPETGEVITVAASAAAVTVEQTPTPTQSPEHPSRYQPPRPDAEPVLTDDGQQVCNGGGRPLWLVDGVECYLSRDRNGRTFLRSTGQCPVSTHPSPMFAEITGPVRWGHAVPGADTCWLDESQKRAAAAVQEEQLPFTDEEEATAVADPAPFALSASV